MIQAPGLTRKHLTRLESFARDKHSNLVRKSVNYGRKKFYRIVPQWTFIALSNHCGSVIEISQGERAGKNAFEVKIASNS